MRNPPWARDELILALDLYFHISPSHTTSSNPKIIELSQLLNQLPIHNKRSDKQNFRNPNSVYMKLSNFLSLDENYHGTGLIKGSKLDEEMWNEFSSNRAFLAKTAQAIRSNYKSIELSANQDFDFQEEFLEGRVLTRLHVQKERNIRATKRKKEIVIAQTGFLACEVCKFDFLSTYGELGKGFAECHHKKPISELNAETATRLDDLAIVCANCHRMLHKAKPMLSLDALRQIVLDNRK